ncbi:hypothetical protein KCU83_g234, partial [Aureobasidium melanogenum]
LRAQMTWTVLVTALPSLSRLIRSRSCDTKAPPKGFHFTCVGIVTLRAFSGISVTAASSPTNQDSRKYATMGGKECKQRKMRGTSAAIPDP